jgi:hypothetical protein
MAHNQFPLPDALNTKVLGIHQGDLIIKSALDVAIEDLRRHPELLNYVWASLLQDPITAKEYGQVDLESAKKWFLNTNIPIKVAPIRNELVSPSIDIILASSEEVTAESTVGDINPETAFETNGMSWPSLAGPLTPVSYDSKAGTVAIDPADLPEDIFIGPGMFIIDKVGKEHEVLASIDAFTFQIAPNTVADFRKALVKGHRPAWVTSIESSSFRESYRIAVNAGPEPSRVTLLHSVIIFCLLRYKQILLEGRGFERSTVSSSDIGINPSSGETEVVFVRYVTLSGYVRNYWPKVVAPAIDVVQLGALRIDGVDTLPADTDPNQASWLGENDSISPVLRK